MFLGPRDPYEYDKYLKKRCGGKERKHYDYGVHDYYGGPEVYDPYAPVIGKLQVSK